MNRFETMVESLLNGIDKRVVSHSDMAYISSSLKDLMIASLIEDLKEGKLELKRHSLTNAWYLKPRS